MNEIPNRIIYSDIETVSDLLLRLNQELSLKMNVRFGHTNMKTNERESYIKGYLIIISYLLDIAVINFEIKFSDLDFKLPAFSTISRIFDTIESS